MADRIATGEIYVEVNDREAIASLHRIDAEFDKEMSKIDRQHADVKLGADLDKLKRDLREAEARVKAYDKKIKDAENKRSAASLARYRKEAEAAAQAKRKEVEGAEAAMKASRAQNKELEATEKRLVAIAKRDEKIAKASEKAAKQESARARDRMREIDREANRRKGLNDQRVREERADERAANNMRREQAMVPKLERSYMRLQDRLEKMAQAKRKAGKDVRAHYIIEIEEHDTVRELNAIKNRIRKAVGRDPIGLPAKPVMGRDAGRNLRLDFERNGRQLGPAAAAAGLRIGHTMGQKVAQGFRNITERGGLIANTKALGSAIGGAAGRGATSGLSRIGHAFDGLANMTVRLGPFTSTIRQLVVVMSLLGPSIVDVVGALGSLVSVVGSGALGLANLGTAIVGGGIPALIGMVTVLKPVIGEMKNASAASQAYAKAVREHGKGSDEAKKKLDIFNNVMKHQTDLTKANFLAAGHLKEAWAKATDPSRREAFKVMGEGLGFLTRNVKFFGDRTNATFAAVGGSLSRVIKGLDSAEGHQVLGTMMDNFNGALRPAIDGVANLAAVFGRFGASASRYLPGLAKQFRNWTEGLLDGSKNADVVNKKVDTMMTSLKSVGRFLLAGGRLLVAFFRGGVNAGTKFTDTMTHAMERWTDFLNTTEGQDKLHDFFDRAVSGAQALFGALAPVLTTFVKWSTAISPFATAFFKGAAAVANLVGKLLSMTALTGPISALAATLGTLWAIGKIQTATMAVANFGRALLGVQALGARRSALSFLGGTFTRDAAALRGATTAANAIPQRTFARPPRTQSFAAPVMPAGAARETERVAASAARGAGAFSRLRGAAGGAVTALTGLTPAAAAGVLAVGGLAYGIYKLATREKDWENNQRNAIAAHKQFVSAVEATPAALNASAQANLSYAQSARSVTTDEHAVAAAQRTVNKLREQGKTGTQQYRAATDNLRSANDSYKQSLIDEYNQKQQLEAINARATKTRDTALSAANREHVNAAQAVKDMENHSQSVRGLIRDYEKYGKAGQSIQDFAESRPFESKDMKDYINALGDLRASSATVKQAFDLFTLSGINSQRAMAGLVPIADNAAGAVSNLVQKIGRTQTAKIALKFPDAKQAAQAMQGVNRAVKSGVSGKAAVNVVTNAPNIGAALRGLNQIKLTPKNLRIFENGGKEAVRRLEMIAGRKLTKKELKIAEAGGPGVLALLEKINGKKIPKKTQYLAIQGVSAVMSGLNSVIRKIVPNKRFTLSVADQASSIVNSIARSVNALHGKDITITTHHRDLAVKGGYAGRVIEAASAGQDMVGRALAAASARQPKITRGGKYSAPTLLVGEENRTEYVIATNPSYRENNKRYLRRAAGDLGMTVVDAARKGKPKRSHDYGHHYAGGKKGHHGIGPHRGAKHPLPVTSNQSLTSDYIPEHYSQTTSARATDERNINTYDKQLRDADESYFRTTKGPKGNRSRNRIAGRIERLKKLRAGAIKKLARDRKAQQQASSDYKNYSKYKNNIEQWTTQMNTDATVYNNTPLDKLPKDPKTGNPAVLEDWQKLRGKREGAYTKLIALLQEVRKHAPKKYQSSIDAEIKGAIDSRTSSQFEAPPSEYEPPTGKTFEAFIKEQNYTEKLSSDEAALARARADTPDDLSDDQTQANTLRDDYKALYDAAVRTGQSSDIIREAATAYTDAREAALNITPTSEAPQGLVYGGAVADSLKADVLRDFGGNTSPFSGLTLSDPSSAGVSWTQQNPAALNPAVAPAVAASVGPAAAGNLVAAGGAGGGVTKVINQTNNFQQPPADAHTFSQAVSFELGAAI